MESNDRTKQVDWLRLLAADIAYMGDGTDAEALVEYALGEGADLLMDNLPTWFDDQDRALLVRFVQEALA